MSALVLAGVLLVAPAPYQPAHYDLSALPPYRPQQQAIGVVYEPGWRWSEHVGAKTGAQLCEVEHICYVLSGRSGLRMRLSPDLRGRALVTSIGPSDEASPAGSGACPHV